MLKLNWFRDFATKESTLGQAIYSLFRILLGDFPSDPVIKIPPFNAEGVGLIPGRGTRIPHTAWCSQK